MFYIFTQHRSPSNHLLNLSSPKVIQCTPDIVATFIVATFIVATFIVAAFIVATFIVAIQIIVATFPGTKYIYSITSRLDIVANQI